MPKPKATQLKFAAAKYLELVQKVAKSTTQRSENDLSAKLARVFEACHLYTVLDTGGGHAGSRKRPDIRCYLSKNEADLALASEVVVESKKPSELEQYKSLADALTSDEMWKDKTFPYLLANITRVHYFVLTTFTHIAFVRVNGALRSQLAALKSHDDPAAIPVRLAVHDQAISFDLTADQAGRDWIAWLSTHLGPAQLAPPSLSSILNSRRVESESDIEAFASSLAAFAAGAADEEGGVGLFDAIRSQLPSTTELLDAETKRDLNVYVMTQQPGLTIDDAVKLAEGNYSEWADDFTAASVHSLVSRLFALKVIEDGYCVGEENPLIEPQHWIFNTTAYDGESPEQIRAEVFSRLRGLRNSGNALVRRFAEYGFFFDWIELKLDPIVHRGLIELFAAHQFGNLKADLLGRFYEHFAQRINRSTRKALGQYYTPRAIVKYIWAAAWRSVREHGAEHNVNVLDPGMGSATFLAHGASVLATEGVSAFWERLTGFDISAQVIGIAHVNLYIAVLAELQPADATKVTDLRLYTTDSLDPKNGAALKSILPLLSDGQHREFIERRIKVSAEAKQEASYDVVVGNPPYRNNSRFTLKDIAQRFPRLLKSSADAAGAKRRNIRDDYAWFFAASDFLIREQGVIAFVVSDSFIRAKSYAAFRRAIVQHYSIREVVRLGSAVFSDVGYRISFVIIVLERRASGSELAAGADTEEYLYSDISTLVDEGEETPALRLAALEDAAAADGLLPGTVKQKGTASSGYVLYPLTRVVERVQNQSLGLSTAKSDPGVFARKWPGIITAFDALFRDIDASILATRLAEFFAAARTKGGAAKEKSAIRKYADKHQLESELVRLEAMARQVAQSHLKFDKSLIKRSFSGSLAEDAKWYPPASNVHFLYYEPGIQIPRNKHEGKEQGWGSMGQWRDPDSHLVTPKLIYTTAAKAKHGYRAFIVHDEWYVKLHGGVSQQFNYTGVHLATHALNADGSPNNLSEAGQALLRLFRSEGEPDVSLLYYCAAFYNSALAEQLLEEMGSSMPMRVRKPNSATEAKLAVTLAKTARHVTEIVRLQALVGAAELISETAVAKAASVTTAEELGLKLETVSKKGFKAATMFRIPTDFERRVAEGRDEGEAKIDALVEELMS